MNQIDKLNKELKESGEKLTPCIYLEKCMENYDLRAEIRHTGGANSRV